MDLHAYLQVLRRNWLLLTVVLLVCVAGSVVATRMQTPAYESSTSLLVTTTEAASPDEESSQRRLAAERASTLAQLASVEPVREAVSAAAAEQSGLSARPVTDVQATAAGNDPFLGITVRDADPAWAQAVAQAYPEGMAAALLALDPLAADAARGLAVLSPANLPVDPVNADPLRNVLLGLLLGAVLGAGLVVLRESLDRQVRDADDVARELELPVRGVVPQGGSRDLLPVRTSPFSARAEAYRAVQAGLSFAEGRALPRTLLLTSASTGEGVTSVAANVAVALARSGRLVTLVDANMRDPRLHDVLGSRNDVGLAEVLAGTARADTAVQRSEQGNLLFLSAGSAPGDPAELLTSRSTALLLNELEQTSEIVIIDAPPVLPVADALVLAAQVEAVLLVVRTGRNSRDRIRRARDAVLRVQGPLEGLVVNGAADAEEQLRPRGRTRLASSGATQGGLPDGPAPLPTGSKRHGRQPAEPVAVRAASPLVQEPEDGAPGEGARRSSTDSEASRARRSDAAKLEARDAERDAQEATERENRMVQDRRAREAQERRDAETQRQAREVPQREAREAADREGRELAQQRAREAADQAAAERAARRRAEQAARQAAARRAAAVAQETAAAAREAAELAAEQEAAREAARQAAEEAAQEARRAAEEAAQAAVLVVELTSDAPVAPDGQEGTQRLAGSAQEPDVVAQQEKHFAAASAPDVQGAPHSLDPVVSPTAGPRSRSGKPRKVIKLRPSSATASPGPTQGGSRTADPDVPTGSSPAR